MAAKLSSQKKSKVVLVGGCFDILHLGHIVFLQKAREQGEKLVVILEGDKNITLRKGVGKPVNPQEARAKVLEAIKWVDEVIRLPFMEQDSDYDRVVKELKPDIIAITAGDLGIEHKKRTAKLVGAKVKVASKLIKGYSSGEISRKIKSSN